MQTHFTPAAPLRITHPNYRGTTHQLLQLPQELDVITLEEAWRQKRLLASVSGVSACMLVQEGEYIDSVEHNIPGLSEIYFRRMFSGRFVQTRIKAVYDDRLLIWGVHESSDMLGLYECSCEHIRLVTQNRFEAFGSLHHAEEKSLFPFTHEKEWDGEIEYVWQSLNKQSLAWLFKPTGSENGRQLFLNGRLLHHGQFEMRKTDFVWAPDGIMGGASIVSIGSYEDPCQKIVTPTKVEQIPTGFHLREFLVNTRGEVVASILDDAFVSHPFVRNHPNDQVSFAWNLRWMPDGSIGYNYIQSFHLSHMTDETIHLR
ncbi:MAG: hypothetical protein AAB664_04040 [Patescibacteria group bacterium]